MARIKIDDLPIHEKLDTKEMKGIKGGRAAIGTTSPILDSLGDAGVEEGDEIRLKARETFGGDDPGW
jgi:hypothetical protein